MQRTAALRLPLHPQLRGVMCMLRCPLSHPLNETGGLCNAGLGETQLMSWRSQDDIEAFMRSDEFLRFRAESELTPAQRDEVCTAIAPHLERLRRSQDWAQLSAPVRARFLGLLVGDGSAAVNVSISLQARLCMLCMPPALNAASQLPACNASLMPNPHGNMLFRGGTSPAWLFML